MKNPYVEFSAVLEPPKSDVHVCDKCGQVALSEVGGPVPDAPFQVEPCDVSVVRRVMES